MRKTLLLLSLLLTVPVWGQFTMISGPTAESFFTTNDARYVNVSGDAGLGPMSGASNAFELRDGTNAQTFRVYNTYTDASNHERGIFGWSGNILQVGSQKSGTGATRQVDFMVGGTAVWALSGAGHLTPKTTGAYDVGAATVGIRHVYVAAVTAPGTPTVGAVLYVDTADGDLKVKFNDGNVVVIGNKP